MATTNIRLLSRGPYGGSCLGIVIGIDVGTTFSGVSYAILRPGEVPEIVPVSRFSGINVSGAKIPSVIFYDKDLKIQAIGPQTTLDSVLADAEEQEWFKAEHFKLHLRPPGTVLQTNGLQIGELPHGKTAEEVMGNYLRYLHEETAAFIKLGHSDGNDLWEAVKDRATFILGHPNGWKGLPQQRYRTSAILGGLIPDTEEGRKRVKFVTEGEASALACLSGGLGPPSLQSGFRFVIADAGGGTIDVSTFEVTKSSPIELKECVPPDGRFAGSVFVNKFAKDFLQEKLRNTKYADELIMKDIIESFDAKTKQEFNGSDGFLRVGDRRDKNTKLGITSGFLSLSSAEIGSFFRHSVSGLVDAVNHQLSASESNRTTTPVWLVGGFAASPYLLRALQAAFKSDGVTIQCPETNLAKAVANGTVLHFLDEAVTQRPVEASYGTTCEIPFQSRLKEHRDRQHLVKEYVDGTFIGPTFSCIAGKNVVVGTRQKSKRSYYITSLNEQTAVNFTAELLRYTGNGPVPLWYDENKDMFDSCIIHADLSQLICDRNLVRPLFKKPYWRVEFDIELTFGTTEVEANIAWSINGKKERGPVKKLEYIDRKA